MRTGRLIGLCGVIAAHRLGRSRSSSWAIIATASPSLRNLVRLMSSRNAVQRLSKRVLEITGGLGAHSVLECVGLERSTTTALNIVRTGGAVGRVGVPQDTTIPLGDETFYKNVSIAGGPAPVRAYVEELLPDVLEGKMEPGRVFNRTTNLDGVPEGYRAMNDREAIKVMIEF